MTLGDHQAAFSLDASRLIQYAFSRGWRVRLRMVQRTPEEQARLVSVGASKTLRSKHVECLAVDAVLDLPIVREDGTIRWQWQQSSEAYRELGAFWESLSEHNVWGGSWVSFQDGNHFERDRRQRTRPAVTLEPLEQTV